MFSAELAGERALLVVAQRPFEAGSERGVTNLFCNLQPLVMENGTRAVPEDFPDNGFVWWLVRSGARGFAEPGRLLLATLEESLASGTSGKSWYQAHVDNIEPARPSKVIEVVRAPGNWIADPREIVSSGRQLTLDHPPMEKVYLNWQGYLYGPLKTLATPSVPGDWNVEFAADHAENVVSKIPEGALQRLPPGRLHDLTVPISLDNRQADSTDFVHECSWRLILAHDFSKWIEKEGVAIVLEGDESLIRRYARQYLSRKARQEFAKLLDLLHDLISADPGASEDEVLRVTNALRFRIGRADVAADELARSLLESGMLEPRLKPLLDQAEARHVEKNTAKLQAEIDARVGLLRSDLESLERDSATRKQKLEQELSARQSEFERLLSVRRQESERECEAERERLQAQKQELDRQSRALSGNLQQVVQQMVEGRDALVNQFLAISPLLQHFNLISQGAPTPSPAAPSREPAARALRSPLASPAFLATAPESSPVTEDDFFRRFCEHVERSGYKYRLIDLAGFHFSVKCHDLTVLGGPPGTGKSSLPRLYAEALLGEEHNDGGGRYLHVGVSPSWLDMRDLLGQTNLLDHCFQPAECGLYPLLVWAQEEHEARGQDTRMYLICLDEMNLAQVEHYFSGFLQALERVPGQREVRCFAAEMVGPDDPFARWPMLRLPPSVRFVGTVNFDETTRQLSQRVLDRCNLIRLPSRYSLDAAPPKKVPARGPAITLGHIAGWVKESAGMDRTHAELLDALSEPLTRMGCPLNPRRYQAIRRLLGNVPPSICSPAEVLDLQIAQRVLPQMRNLFRPGAKEGLKAFRRALEAAPIDFPESLTVLQEVEDREAVDELFDGRIDE
jgi:hypothetical protein